MPKKSNKEEESATEKYYSYLRNIAKRKARPSPFLGAEDLLQEVLILTFKLEQEYGDNPNLERIIKHAAKLHIWNLIEKYTNTRDQQLVEQLMILDPDCFTPEEDLNFNELVFEVRKIVSEDAITLINELLQPSEELEKEAEEIWLRRLHIAIQGNKAPWGTEKPKITIEMIRKRLKFSKNRFYSVKEEIIKAARKVKCSLGKLDVRE